MKRVCNALHRIEDWLLSSEFVIGSLSLSVSDLLLTFLMAIKFCHRTWIWTGPNRSTTPCNACKNCFGWRLRLLKNFGKKRGEKISHFFFTEARLHGTHEIYGFLDYGFVHVAKRWRQTAIEDFVSFCLQMFRVFHELVVFQFQHSFFQFLLSAEIFLSSEVLRCF